LFSLFGPRLPIDADELDFQLATFKWLQRQFGELGDAALVLPTPEFFPSVESGRADPRKLFDDVRRAAGMDEWPCRLEAGAAERPIEAGNAHLLRHEGEPPPCGTFRVEEEDGGHRAVITYNPSMANDPIGLAATFAHELGHYMMATSAGTPPGGWELHELHTDIAAVYLGFGIFLANSARSFSQFQSGGQSGWSARWQGYLSEGALVTALVVRERLAVRDAAAAKPYLKDYLQSDLRKAEGALRRLHPDMQAAVEAVDLAEYGAS
jgi:hypothetical protein